MTDDRRGMRRITSAAKSETSARRAQYIALTVRVSDTTMLSRVSTAEQIETENISNRLASAIYLESDVYIDTLPPTRTTRPRHRPTPHTNTAPTNAPPGTDTPTIPPRRGRTRDRPPRTATDTPAKAARWRATTTHRTPTPTPAVRNTATTWERTPAPSSSHIVWAWAANRWSAAEWG